MSHHTPTPPCRGFFILTTLLLFTPPSLSFARPSPLPTFAAWTMTCSKFSTGWPMRRNYP
nr:MAG TPA: hypothetical protein [Caudoviricetes sp.]